jgi:hypothetical protein
MLFSAAGKFRAQDFCSVEVKAGLNYEMCVFHILKELFGRYNPIPS